MSAKQTKLLDNKNYHKVIRLLQHGNFSDAEALVFAKARAAGAGILQTAMAEVHGSHEGKTLVDQLQATYHYRTHKQTRVTVTVAGEHKITVPSYYALAQSKKMGRPKKGRNGTGTHVLLAYWGFTRKRSPGSMNEIVRAGAASASYELAAEQLRSQGVQTSGQSVCELVQYAGAMAASHRGRNHLALESHESLAGKRVAIGLDGGRIRSRKTKTGRPKKGHQHQGYDTDWKEPKLLVITELDEHGNKQKAAKPIYEATMDGKEEFTQLLISLSTQLHLDEATEIVALGDGAPVLWDVFGQLQKKLRIKGKTTEVVDFFHACEHITELTEAHTKQTANQRQQWAKELKGLLRTGNFQAFCTQVRREAKKHDLPVLLKHLSYFERHRTRMHYDHYEQAMIPIGSGIVESAIRRVINGRLKAPGSFWRLENAEAMLAVRSALLAGRWKTFMDNMVRSVSIRPDGVLVG